MLIRVSFLVALLMLFGGAARAQENCQGPWPKPGQSPTEQYQRLLGCIKQSVAEAKIQLGDLSKIKIDEFANGLESERDQLRGLLDGRTKALDQARGEIDALVKERDALDGRVKTLTVDLEKANVENEGHIAALQKANAAIAALVMERDRLSAVLKDANDKITALNAEIDRLKAALKKAGDENIILTITLNDATAKIAALEKERDQLKKERDDLIVKLNVASETIAALEIERDKLKADLKEASAKIAELQKERDDLAAKLKIANETIVTLEIRVKQLSGDLDLANGKIRDLEKQIADLKCNVDRLGAQRSAFFASLSEVLGKDADVKIVGDRFVIPSWVLFPVGSAALSKEGINEIDKVARVVRDLEGKIPASVSWVLQVDGHTDIQKILPGGEFKDNWELSTARALTVVQLLRDNKVNKVSPEHLAAAGFGEHHPIDPAKTQAAYTQNRRIELKLTDDGPGNANSAGSDGKECPALVSMN